MRRHHDCRLTSGRWPGDVSRQRHRGRSCAGTKKATTLTWAVPDAKAAAAALASKGVRFEHCDMPGITREGDIHVGYGMKSAWFKDPDGNILQILSQ